ncbi:MAG: phosphoglycerate kinase [Candidatus Gracilibacteria bacterium]|jgi:phosphoglycerate kinase
MSSLRTLHSTDFSGKRVLLRTDYNVPVKDGEVQDRTRIEESLPTLRFLESQGAKIIIASHLGRPKGKPADEFRLDPVARELSALLGKPVKKLDDCVGPAVEAAIATMQAGDIILLENLRFHPEEEANDPHFAQALAALADVFVSDAFGTVHRAHASTEGIGHQLPAIAGLLIEKEVKALGTLLESPAHPVCLIVGGAKVDTKIGILEKFLTIADSFLIGGALANTFLKAQGVDIGASLHEEEKLSVARKFLAEAAGKEVLLPTDFAQEEVEGSFKILDLGEKTVEAYLAVIEKAKTIIWNGPLGLYEMEAFAKGTKAIAKGVAESGASTVLGGGDTVDAIHHFGYTGKEFGHISTGGGAMLEFLEGKELPGLKILMD